MIHALFQWLFHTKFNSHIFPHKPCLLSKALPQIAHISSHTSHALFHAKTLPQKIHTSSHPTHVFFSCLLSMEQGSVCAVFCCTFMNPCNPDSSTKTHISSNSSLQKIHISSHPEHVFFHKGSHILSPKHAIFQRLFHRKPRYLPTQTMPSFKDPSTEYSHIISHKACLFNNSSLQKILSSSHPTHVFLHAFFHKESHILSPTRILCGRAFEK